MTWDIPHILELAVSAIVGLLCLLYKYHEDRLKTLEVTRQNKVDADQQRAELREELQDFRHEVGERFKGLSEDTAAKRNEAHHELSNFKADISAKVEIMRVESNAKLDKLAEQNITLVAQIAALSTVKRKR